jgi:hypothetical protein
MSGGSVTTPEAYEIAMLAMIEINTTTAIAVSLLRVRVDELKRDIGFSI